jgi:hypothetical protein
VKKQALALVGALLAAAAPAAAQGQAQGKKYNFTLAGASPSGVWSNIGLALDRAVAATYPGSAVTYQTSGGGFANIALVDRKQVPLALASDGEMKLALDGKEPFKQRIDSMSAIAFVHGWLYTIPVVTREFADRHGLEDVADIARKKPPIRLSVNRPGILVSVITLEFLKELGVGVEDIKKWGGNVVYAASVDTTQLMGDRKLDGHIMNWPLGDRNLSQQESALDLKMLSVKDRSVSDRVCQRLGIVCEAIPAGTYKWQPPGEVYVPTMGGVLITHKEMDAETTYSLAKAIHSNIAAFQSAHPFLKRVTPQFLVSLKTVPYHPGAAKYYKEAGLM